MRRLRINYPLGSRYIVKAHLDLLPSPSGNIPMGKTRGLVLRMECNNTRTDIEHHHERKRARIDKTSIPPHQKDPTPSSSPNGDSGTPTTEKTGPRRLRVFEENGSQ